MAGKKHTDAARRYDRERLHEPQEAFDLVKQLSNRNFDETVEASFRLGVDPRKADQMLRGTVSLPSGTGKDVRVAVFAAGDAAREAEEAGADVVGTDDLVDRIQKGFVDFDVAIATPDLMGQVGKLGRVLGPRGLMPNPKTGTVTNDVGKTVADFKGGKVEYRTDRYGNVQVPLGKVSFPVESLVKNYGAVLDEIVRAKPAAAKGKYLKGITTSSTMGPGIKISPESRVESALTLAQREAEAEPLGAEAQVEPRLARLAEREREPVAVAAQRRPHRVALHDELDAAVAEHLDEPQALRRAAVNGMRSGPYCDLHDPVVDLERERAAPERVRWGSTTRADSPPGVTVTAARSRSGHAARVEQRIRSSRNSPTAGVSGALTP